MKRYAPIAALLIVIAISPLFAGGGRERDAAPPPGSGISAVSGGRITVGAEVIARGTLGVYGRGPERYLALRVAAPPSSESDVWLLELVVTDSLERTLSRYQGRVIEVAGTMQAFPQERRRGAIRVSLLRSIAD